MAQAKDLILTVDPKMIEILATAERIANSKATVLVTGESGTGKELLARYIHSRSPRGQGPFVALNCAAVPDGLLESELFGHERGSFTGAVSSRPGKFEQAHEGTLLLDELGEMPLPLQAKLLRALQEGEVERIGSTRTTKVNVRVIATTHRDLSQMVRLGQFREDLFYRLNVIPLLIPPLRERPTDLEMLAGHFLETSCDINGTQTKTFSTEARKKLLRYSWPGNVRELENVIERAVLLSKTYVIGDLEIQTNSVDSPGLSAGPQFSGSQTFGAGMTVSEAERLLIMKTLDHTRNNKSQAARMLGISVRTLRNKLHEYKEEPNEQGI